MNQSDNDKRAAKKKSTQLSGDLNATHESKPLKEEVVNLSQKVQKKIQPVTSISALISREELAKLDQEFPDLIKDTNLLAEQVKKLSNFKVISYEDRYTIANQKVPLRSGLIPDLDKITRAKDKNFFLALEEALDNTFIIDANPHEAASFKPGVLYKLFLDEDPSIRLIEMSIAIRDADFPDCFKYIKKDHIRRKATWMELAQQVYDEICKDPNLDTQKRFQASCENFKEIYLGLKFNQIDLDAIQGDEINFPEIPDTLLEHQLNSVNNTVLPKQSTRTYINFTRNELNILKSFIPGHKKNTVFIPEIGGIDLDTFMRDCSSKQTVVNEHNDTELRKRTAAEKFIFKAGDIIGSAQNAMKSDKTGQMFDPHQGYVSYKADPENICKEINKEREVYQKELIIIEDCKLSGSKLTKVFFERVIVSLELALARELKILCEKYEKMKIETSFFHKSKLKIEYQQEKKQTEENNRQAIAAMKDFQRIVELVGAENIKIFAATQDGKASYSIPKNFLVIDAVQSISSRSPIKAMR